MDNITRSGIQYVPNDIKEEFVGNAELLMQSAIQFIKELQSIVEKYQHLKQIVQLRSKDLTQIKYLMQENNAALREIILAQYNFEERVNAFLGRKIHFAWVDVETGEVFFVDEASAKNIYVLASQGKGYAGNIKFKDDIDGFKKKLSQLPSFIEEQYKNILNDRINRHQNLFKTIIYRLDENYRESNFWSKDHAGTIWWQHPPKGADNFNHKKYAWSIKTSKGFISQGYINFIFNSTYSFIGESEYNIGSFMMGYVEKGDKIPGIVKGDIIVDSSNSRVQVAVKSNTLFSTASVGPYITTAYKIIDFYDNLNNLTIENVEKILKNLETYAYQKGIFRISQEKVQKKLEQIFLQSGATVL